MKGLAAATGLGVMVAVGVAGTPASARDLTTRCEQNGYRVECVSTPGRPTPNIRFRESSPDPTLSVLQSMENMNVRDPSEGVARRRIEEEQLEAIKRENAFRQQQINNVGELRASWDRIGTAMEQADAHCEQLFNTRQIKTYHAKADCAAKLIMPMLEHESAPVEDILKGAYAQAKIIAKKADQKKISVDEMELQEAQLAGEVAERLRERFSWVK